MMSTNPPTPANGGSRNGDAADAVASIAQALDRLAQAERAAAGPVLEARVLDATRVALGRPMARDTAAMAGIVDALAGAERAGAAATLEDRVFMATAGLLRRGSESDAPAPAQPPMSRRPFAGRSLAWRAAAAVLLVASGSTVWWAALPSHATLEPDQSIGQLLAEVGTLSTSAGSSTSLALFDDLRRDVESLDQRVNGDWFGSDSLIDDGAL